jgi:hypothetical protein
MRACQCVGRVWHVFVLEHVVVCMPGAKESRRGEEDESRMPIKHGGTGGHSHVLLRMAEEYNTCVWYIPCAYCVWNIPCVCARTHRLRTRSAKEAWVYSTSLATQRTSFRSTTCSSVVSVTASPSLLMTRPDTMLAARAYHGKHLARIRQAWQAWARAQFFAWGRVECCGICLSISSLLSCFLHQLTPWSRV